MSLINQVLNDLEKRGTKTVAKTDMVRAVPAGRRSSPLIWGLAGAMLAAVVLGLLFWLMRYRESVRAQSTVPVSVVRHEAAMPRPASARGPQTARNPPATPEPAAVGRQPATGSVPSLNLSFELATIPLPSSKPSEKHQFKSRPKPKPARQTVHQIPEKQEALPTKSKVQDE